MHGGRSSLCTLRLTDLPEGPGKVWPWVILYFGALSPFALIVSCSWHPNGAIDAYWKCWIHSIGSGSANPNLISLSMSSSRTALFCLADWWFPRCRWNSRSNWCSSSGMGTKGNSAPCRSKNLIWPNLDDQIIVLQGTLGVWILTQTWFGYFVELW